MNSSKENVVLFKKKGKELSLVEINQIENIYKSVIPSMPSGYITSNYIDRMNPIFYLYKLNNEIIAYQAQVITKKETPFHTNKIFVFLIVLSFKDLRRGELAKDFARKTNFSLLREYLGFFWFFKKYLFVLHTLNPKATFRISKFFPKVFPNLAQETPEKVFHFGYNILNKDLKKNIHLNKNLVSQGAFDKKTDITDLWSRLFKSKNKGVNDFFFDNDIITKANNSYYLTGKGILLMVFYSFWPFIFAKLFKKRKTVSNNA